MISNEAVEAAAIEEAAALVEPHIVGAKHVRIRVVTLRRLLSRLQSSAAPHMLPAPEGVSEAEKHLAHIAQLLTPPDEDAIRILLSSLSSERERAEGLKRERDEARQGERNLSEHARKVADEANDAFGVVERMEEFWDACGHPSNRGHLTPAEQVSAIVRERDDAEDRAQSAQAEATRLKEKLDEAGKVIADLMTTAPSETAINAGHAWFAALRWTEEASQGEGE